MLCGRDPILLTKNVDGVKITVLAFDIHNSNLPLLMEFPVLLNNLGVYSIPPTVERAVFYAGEDIIVNVKPATRAMVINDTQKTSKYDIFPVIIPARHPGVYAAMQFSDWKDVITDRFFVRTPKNESIFNLAGDELPYLTVAAGAASPVSDPDIKNTDNLRDLFFYFAAALSVFVLIEWWLQYREHY
jgi:hypothetical protein